MPEEIWKKEGVSDGLQRDQPSRTVQAGRRPCARDWSKMEKKLNS